MKKNTNTVLNNESVLWTSFFGDAAYQAEDEDFTDAQIENLRENSPAKNVPDELFKKLY